MKYNNNLNKDIKSLIEKYNGKIVTEDLHLMEDEIDWDNKTNQTRDGDLDRGHIAALSADIKARGLQNKPLFEFDAKIGLYRIVSGHHRAAALRSLLSEEEKQDKIPCASVEFNTPLSREFFMQNENHHPPTKPHTRKDAIRFIKNSREHGYFDSSNGDTEIIKSKVFSLLEKFYCRLNVTSQNEVFHEAFKDRQMTRVLTILKVGLSKIAKDLFPSLETYNWKDNRYLCYGNSDNVRKSMAVALEKRVHKIKENPALMEKRGKVSVVTHFSATSKEDVERSRVDFLETERLLNKYAYGPGNILLVWQVVFAPQVDGVKGVKEKDPILYQWDFDEQKFMKQSNRTKLAA